jgi:spore coat protein U-like protein
MPGHRPVSSWNLLAACLMLCASSAAAAACNVSPQGVSFGNYDPLGGSAVDGVGNVNVSCDVETSFTVSLGTVNGTVGDRRMTGAPAHLAYNLYRDSSRLLVWGEAGAGVSSSGTNIDLTVYGRIPGAQNVPANVYADSVTVTVAF